MSNKVRVVVPIYKSSLSKTENISIDRCFKILSSRNISMVKPRGLNTDLLEKEYPFYSIEEFDADYFTSIKGYNRLLLATEFYSRFQDDDYMLIVQSDVYIFYDDLDYWLNEGYDYVGAPWISSSRFSHFIHYVKMKCSHCLYGEQNRVHRFETRNRVGNGGFSLRKISRHLELTAALKDQIQHYLNNQTSHIFNEDVFWSIEPSKNGFEHKTPTAQEALRFAFDINPKRLYKLTGGKLPMAAHGWNKSRSIKFWQVIIDSNKINRF